MSKSDAAVRRVADPSITAIQQEYGAGRSPRQRYADLVVGQDGWWPLIRHELTMLSCSWIPGALGVWLRSRLYRLILGRMGRNVAIGTNVVLRHPGKIFIGDGVVIGHFPDGASRHEQISRILTPLNELARQARGSLVMLNADAEWKREFAELGGVKATTPLSQRLKSAFDPHGLLNPGRLVDPA